MKVLHDLDVTLSSIRSRFINNHGSDYLGWFDVVKNTLCRPLSASMVFSDGIWDFSLTRYSQIELILFHWSCICLLIDFDTHI